MPSYKRVPNPLGTVIFTAYTSIWNTFSNILLNEYSTWLVAVGVMILEAVLYPT